MKADRVRWNRKYRDQTHPTGTSAIVKRYFRRARQGRALDLACGNGRNALFLVDQGFQVDAVDISDAGLSLVPRRPHRLHLVCADLDTFSIPRKCFDLILNIRYLNRRLFPYILEGLKRGGLLIFETYLEKKGATPKKISCRDHLLRPNELLHAFIGMHILYYEEKADPDGGFTASLVAVRETTR